MQFGGVSLRSLFSDTITVWSSSNHLGKGKESTLQTVIDAMGKASAKAQGLHHVITTFDKLMLSDHRVYMYVDLENNTVAGLLKVGVKKLFHMNQASEHKELTPLCVLDFYVHESCQRSGIGLQLFMAMLSAERVAPHELAYDRPSAKLQGFLRKHFSLSSYVPQANNFVIFNAYFDSKYVPVNNSVSAGSSGSTKGPSATPPSSSSLGVTASAAPASGSSSSSGAFKGRSGGASALPPPSSTALLAGMSGGSSRSSSRLSSSSPPVSSSSTGASSSLSPTATSTASASAFSPWPSSPSSSSSSSSTTTASFVVSGSAGAHTMGSRPHSGTSTAGFREGLRVGTGGGGNGYSGGRGVATVTSSPWANASINTNTSTATSSSASSTSTGSGGGGGGGAVSSSGLSSHPPLSSSYSRAYGRGSSNSSSSSSSSGGSGGSEGGGPGSGGVMPLSSSSTGYDSGSSSSDAAVGGGGGRGNGGSGSGESAFSTPTRTHAEGRLSRNLASSLPPTSGSRYSSSTSHAPPSGPVPYSPFGASPSSAASMATPVKAATGVGVRRGGGGGGGGEERGSAAALSSPPSSSASSLAAGGVGGTGAGQRTPGARTALSTAYEPSTTPKARHNYFDQMSSTGVGAAVSPALALSTAGAYSRRSASSLDSTPALSRFSR